VWYSGLLVLVGCGVLYERLVLRPRSPAALIWNVSTNCIDCIAQYHIYISPYPALYLLVYSLSFLAQNFGPNATTYILLSVRGTWHLSSIADKLDGVLGSQIFLLVARAFCSSDSDNDSNNEECEQEKERLGMQLVFWLCGLISLLGYAMLSYDVIMLLCTVPSCHITILTIQ